MRILLRLILAACCLLPLTAAAQVTGSQTLSWKGFEKNAFTFNGSPAWVVKPHQALPGNPWIWRAYFPDWHTDMDSILLQRGFHIAYIHVRDRYGDPAAMQTWDHFYAYLTTQRALAARPALEAVSRGGLYAYAWAKRNPLKVSCIYAEAPVCDVKSWPGGKGAGKGDSACWKQLLNVYGFREEQALAFKDNPADNLEGLAACHVPVLHVISLKDEIVPPAENTLPLVQQYIRLGGTATVHPVKEGPKTLSGHHFPITHPERFADFICTHTLPVATPLPDTGWFALRNGLTRAYTRFREQKTGTVAFLGGSITHNGGWRDKVSQYLREHFPGTAFRFINAGIPSLGSLPHAFRLGHDLPELDKTDLLFVEAAVNDRVNQLDSAIQLQTLEGIVRHARRSNPAMDIVLMSFADPEKLEDYAGGRIPAEVSNHERIAAHYRLPSVNLAAEIAERINAREFSWEDDFEDLHPAPFGQEMYFKTIKALLAKESKPSPPQPLPAPLTRYSFDKGRYLSVTAARPEKGWRLHNDWSPADQAGTRPGFVHIPVLCADTPGAVLTLPFNGTAVGMAILSGPDAGVVEYSIDQSPYRELNLYTRWSKRLHLPWYVLFAGKLKPGKHILRLRISEKSRNDNNAHACRIAYFLVND
ncbi:SGNH/GDSL hydrolase family protein [Chitinophaga sp. Mgbs1]|uniref:SGNH/GDSL hydrolase family protein n=1 Tax=Chitinophaga solisilvae TaxID=1233460 RepID=A0A9Q5CWL6_9BACT|nr:SGNH/GDSL hydrolase family protein [Chitinophaga solisilvae]